MSVFIKETPTGDDMTSTESPLALAGEAKSWQQMAQEICEDIVTRKNKRLDRTNFGKKIGTIGKLSL